MSQRGVVAEGPRCRCRVQADFKGQNYGYGYADIKVGDEVIVYLSTLDDAGFVAAVGGLSLCGFISWS